MVKHKSIWAASAILFGFGLLLAGCGAEQKTETTTAQPETITETAETAAYPIDWCVVSGEKFGAMGDPVVHNYKGRTVKFCCAMCVKTFEADPDAYLAKLDSAAAGMLPGPADEIEEEVTGHEGHDHG